MAIYHHSTSVIKRSAGKSAVAAAAYRSGDKLKDLLKNKTYNYTRKSGVDHSLILSPVAADWILDREVLWNQVERSEKRSDAQLAREVTIAIPTELDRDTKIKLVSQYVRENYVDCGMIADVNFHHLDGDNPHVHVMLTMRDLKIDDGGAVSFGNKNRDWNDKKLLVQNRDRWAELANKYLVEAGFSDRQIDHRSNAERGIEAMPQIHLGVQVAAMRDRGIATDRGDEYDRIEIANNNIRQILDKIYKSELATHDAEQELAELRAEVNYQNNQEVTRDLKFTHPKIQENDEVTTTSIREQRAAVAKQEEDDRTLIFTAGAYPDLKKTPEYQAAVHRSKERYSQQLKSISKQPSEKPEPQIKKWEPVREQDTTPELPRLIKELADKVGSSFELGNYAISIREDRIDIAYKDALSLTINDRQTRLISERPQRTIDQYERGLTKAIDLELDRLKIDEAKQLADQQIEREYQEMTRQQAIELERELEQEQSIDIDFGDVDDDVDFGNRSPDWYQDRYHNFDSR